MGWKRDLKKKMNRQRKMARMSKKQAKKLARIYGDMTPEEIAEINAITPEIATGVDQMQADGYAVNTQDPVQAMAQYNDVYGPGNGENAPYIEDAYGGTPYYDYENVDSESFEDLEDARREAFESLDIQEIRNRFVHTIENLEGEDLEAFEQHWEENLDGQPYDVPNAPPFSLVQPSGTYDKPKKKGFFKKIGEGLGNLFKGSGGGVSINLGKRPGSNKFDFGVTGGGATGGANSVAGLLNNQVVQILLIGVAILVIYKLVKK